MAERELVPLCNCCDADGTAVQLPGSLWATSEAVAGAEAEALLEDPDVVGRVASAAARRRAGHGAAVPHPPAMCHGAEAGIYFGGVQICS